VSEELFVYPFTSTFPILLIQPTQHPLSHIGIDDPADPERRHNPTNPKHKTRRPILQHLRRPARHAHCVFTTLARSVIQIQPQKMQRRTRHLHRRRRQKLRRAHPTNIPLHGLPHRQLRRHDRGEVEARKDRQHVPCRKQGVRCFWHGAGRSGFGDAEEARELGVFVEAEGEVCGACGEEFGRAGGGVGGWVVVEGGHGGVEEVGGGVGRGVEAEDEEEGPRG